MIGIVEIYKIYVKYILPKVRFLRGFTRLKLVLRDLALSRVLEKQEDFFVYEYDDVEIKMKEKEDFEELVIWRDIIEGYLNLRGLNKRDVVLDAGAYPGEFTIYAAKKASKVIALEPDKQNYRKLEQNIELNNLDNVVTKNIALSSEVGDVGFDEGDEDEAKVSGDSSVKISATTIDNISEDLPKESIDFIKMDIEGHEIEAVKGGKSLMENGDPFFSIASYHIVNQKRTCEYLEDFFKNRGYSSKTGFQEHLTTYAWKNDVKN